MPRGIVSPLPEPDRGGFLGTIRNVADTLMNLPRKIQRFLGGGEPVTTRTMFDRPPQVQAQQPQQPQQVQQAPTPTPQPVQIDDRLLDTIAQVESSNNPKAVNPSSGAMGMFQFMPQTVEYVGRLMGRPFDPFNPEEARGAARFYLDYLLKRFGSIELALAAYNAGEGNVEKFGGVPPFAETQNYVSKILGK